MCAEILAGLPLDGPACFFVFYSLEFFYPDVYKRQQMEVAQEIGISQAQVSRLEKAALEQFHQQT